MKYFKLLHIPTATYIINPKSPFNYKFTSIYWPEDCVISFVDYYKNSHELVQGDTGRYLFIMDKQRAQNYSGIKICEEHLDVIEYPHGFDDALVKTKLQFTDGDLTKLDDIYLLFLERLRLYGISKP